MSRLRDYKHKAGSSSSEDMHMVEMAHAKAPGVFLTQSLHGNNVNTRDITSNSAHRYPNYDQQDSSTADTGVVPFLSNPFRQCHWRQHKRKIIVCQIMHVFFILILLLLLFFVVIPAITRSIVAHNDFSIQALSLTNVNDNNLDITVSQSIGSVPFNPRISAFTAKVYTESNDRILDIEIPQFHGEHVQVPSQRVEILNTNAFGSLAATLINNDVKLFLVGSTNVRVLSKNVHISFNKSVSLMALNLQVSVEQVNKTDGVAKAIANVHTSGQVSVDLRNSTFDLLFGSSQSAVGRLTGNVKFAPGNNSLPLVLTPLISTATLSQFVDRDELVAAIAKGSLIATVSGKSNEESSWADMTVQAVQQPVNVTSAQLLAALA